MDSVIKESGMDFIAENTFHIEKSELYRNLGESVRSVEFVRVKDDKLLFVEAKITFPNPNNPSVENFAKYQAEIDEICDKFIHSLNLFSSVKVGVAKNAFTGDFVLPEKVTLMFILVIKEHELIWCKRIKETLMDALPLYLKRIWDPTVWVINQEVAAKYNLVIS